MMKALFIVHPTNPILSFLSDGFLSLRRKNRLSSHTWERLQAVSSKFYLELTG